MTIAFVTTLNPEASTVAGRILPLAKELAAHASVSVYCLGGQDTANNNAIVKIVSVGKEPFLRTGNGKIRLQGISLALRLLQNCWLTLLQLLHDRPDTVIIVKSLPQNTLAVALARLFYRPKKIILDCDDFELEANVLTSMWQRAAIHVSERLALHVSAASVAATPFLADHITRLGGDAMPVTLLPTGIGKNGIALQGQGIKLVYAGSISLSSGHRVDLLPGIMHHLASSYPDVELHICGDGDDVEHVKIMAQEKNVADRLVWRDRPVPLFGVGLPSHFIVQFRFSEKIVYMDPFNRGKLLARRDCIELLRNQEIGFQESYLTPVNNLTILSRSISNLVYVYNDLGNEKLRDQLLRYLRILNEEP